MAWAMTDLCHDLWLQHLDTRTFRRLQMVIHKAPFGMSIAYPYRSRSSGDSMVCLA
ncbi:hypothetical protein V7S43_006128 [Phytophthora oleae]|uniref:Uncharacterized protein n=1 Tax=Phytophthora oleae TaxID=2107226 RepID=A0ABD3FR82_9STRA